MTRVAKFRVLTLGVVGALLLAVLPAVSEAPKAWAAGSVTVTNESGDATADPDYATNVTVSGSGFQSIKNGFGGVYVLFGWVQGSSWKPSLGGLVGTDFRYVPDSEAKDNAGFQRFVSFPGSDTESAAHAVMSDDGSWTVDMVIPGASFESLDRAGKVSAVDCLQVTCGIITIGAHGVKNANNETFTPIAFAAPGDAAQGQSAAKADIGALRVGLLNASVDAGSSVAFTGQGFTPGEQVVATLDNGLVSVGPLAAGAQGEVAGVLPVPFEARGGTHLVVLKGAASGGVAEAELTVVVGTPLVEQPGEETPMWLFVALVVANALALGLIIASVIVALRRARARRKARPAKTGPDPRPESATVQQVEPVYFASAAAPDAPTVELPALTGARP